MKKIISLVLCLMLLLSMSAMAFADGTTTLTTSVPAATYTLNIPADKEIKFGTTRERVGLVSITNSSGFAEGKNVLVTVSYDSFTSDTSSSTLPFSLIDDTHRSIGNGSKIEFWGLAGGSVGSDPVTLFLEMKSTDWGKALGGDYTATITFTSEVVSK